MELDEASPRGLGSEGPGMQRGRGARREPALRPKGVPAGLFLQLCPLSSLRYSGHLVLFTLQILIKPSLSCPEEL